MVLKSILEFVEGLNNYPYDMIIHDYSKILMNEVYKNSTPKTLKLTTDVNYCRIINANKIHINLYKLMALLI